MPLSVFSCEVIRHSVTKKAILTTKKHYQTACPNQLLTKITILRLLLMPEIFISQKKCSKTNYTLYKQKINC